MNKQYIFRYSIKGVNHSPWYPSYVVWADNMKEARKKVKADQEAHTVAKYGRKLHVTPLYGSRYYDRTSSVSPYRTYIGPTKAGVLWKDLKANQRKTGKTLTELAVINSMTAYDWFSNYHNFSGL